MTLRLRRFLVALVACAAVPVLAELGLRWFWPPARGWYVWPPGLDTVHRSDPLLTPGILGPARIQVSSLGLRARELGPAVQRAVLAIGGSTTECLFLDQPETWTALLEERGERRFGRGTVWVGNAGKSGHASREHVLQLERGLEAAPGIDLALVLVGVNDLGRRLARGERYPAAWAQDDALLAQVERGAFDLLPLARETGFPRALALYRVAKLAKLRWQAGEMRTDTFDPAVYGAWRRLRRAASRWRSELPDLASALSEYDDNLRAMIQCTRRHGVRLLFLTQPALWRADLPPELEELLWMGGVGDFQKREGCEYYTTAALAEGMRRYNEALLEVCRAEGVECFDLAEHVERDGLSFYDDVHFTEAGARRVADMLEELVWR